MPESKLSPRRVSAKLRQAQALQARAAGVTFEAIAISLSYHSKQAAYDAVKRGLKQIIETPAQELRELDLRRLDAMLLAIWTRAVGKRDVPAELLAIDRALKILARRAALLGLDRQPGDTPVEPLHLQVHRAEEDEALAGFSDDELAKIVAVGEAIGVLPDGTLDQPRDH